METQWRSLDRLNLAAQRSLPLNQADTAWYIESGRLAIAASHSRSGEAVGWRHRLFSVGEGELVLPLEFRPEEPTLSLVGIAEVPVCAVAIPLDQVLDQLQDQGVAPSEALDSWTTGFSGLIGKLASADLRGGVSERMPSEGQLGVLPGARLDLPKDTTVLFSVTSGTAGLAGLPDFVLDAESGAVPIASGVIIEAMSEHCEFAVQSISELQYTGLTNLKHLVRASLKQYEQHLGSQDKARQRLADEMDRQSMEQALGEVGELLSNNRLAARQQRTELLTAMTIIGDYLGVTLREPARRGEEGNPDLGLQAIVDLSDLRMRDVLLNDGWWKSDCGPLLGFLEEERTPVALIRDPSGTYRIVNPKLQIDRVVNGDTEGMLCVDAKTFSAPIPENISRLSQIPLWAVREVLPDIGFVMGLSALITVIGMLVPQMTAVLVDTAIPDADRNMVIELAFALFAAAFGVSLLGVAQGILSIRFSVASNVKAQLAMFCHVVALRAPFFRKFSSGDLLDRIMAVSEVSEEFNSTTIRTLLTGLTTSLNLGLLFYYNAKLAMIALLLGFLVLGVTVIGTVSIHKHYRVLMKLAGEFSGFVFEIANAVGKIRIAGAQRRVFTLWMRRYTEQVSLMLKAQRTEDYIETLNYSVPLMGSVLIYSAGAHLFAQGSVSGDGLTLGVFLAFNTAMATFLIGLTSMSNTVMSLLDMLAKFKRIKPLIEAEKESTEGSVDPGMLEGGIKLSGIQFRYHQDGPMILSDINLEIEPGKFIALVGPSGCGKSTLLRLLLGFERPEVGQIMFDSYDLDSLSINSVRRQIGTVLQSAKINSGSILENISGNHQLALDDVLAAVRDAGLEEDIEQMPMGLHTIISEGGGNISGGQRQRLLIARALVKDPRILLLDEATSALDNRTQAIVTDSLNRRKVTRVAIAHRLSTIHDADKIIVMNQGRIDQVGTFEELAQMSGLFASMMARQQA